MQRKQRATSRKGAKLSDVPKQQRRDCITVSTTLPKPPRTYMFRQIDPTFSTFSGVVGSSSEIGYYFQATNLGNWASFSALFDQYRILAIRFAFLPRTNVVSGTAYNPPLYTVIDYDDLNTIGSKSGYTQRQNCTETSVYQSLERTFAPRFDFAAYSGVFTSYANTVGWIDCGSPTVQHYGLKVFIESCSTPAPVWDLKVEYYIQFREVI